MPELRSAIDSLFAGGAAGAAGVSALVASLMIAAFIGLAVAWVYQRTHHGLSYSRGFTQSLVVLTMGATLLIFVIGDSLVTAFGLLGALAIVRFRNVLKDTRDTVFVFFSLVLGMAAGTQRYGIALVGGAALMSAVTYLHLVAFGSKTRFDGHITYAVRRGDAGGDEWKAALARIDEVLGRFCRGIERMTSHDSDESVEIVSAVRLRDPERGSEMVEYLRATPGVVDASLVLRDRYAEL
jgi:hypothetical protein